MTAAIRRLNEKAQQREDAKALGPAPAAAPQASIPYVHLKVHSAYSLLEGALPIGKIAKLAEKLGYPAVGLTDTNNMFGALEFSDKLAAAGIQPIVGCTLATDFLDAKQGDGLPRTGRNEPIYEEEVVEAFLAPDDPRRYFELESNPRGAWFDFWT
jgi:DNA polymerase III alpha subunit